LSTVNEIGIYELPTRLLEDRLIYFFFSAAAAAGSFSFRPPTSSNDKEKQTE
jgi:hypothetical protein